MANELVVSKQTSALIPSEHEWQVYQIMSNDASQSGLYNGVGGQKQILMIMLAARELGISPMSALNGGIHCIKGKIEISARLMGAMIRQAGHSISVKQLDNSTCTLDGKRKDNGDMCSVTFTLQEAKQAGLYKEGSNWSKFTQDMLYARALSRLARRLFPDVIGIGYIEGEIQEAENYKYIPSSESMVLDAEVQLDPPEDIPLSKMEEFLEVCAKNYQVSKNSLINSALKNPEKFFNSCRDWMKTTTL